MRFTEAAILAFFLAAFPAAAQEEPVPSKCIAIAGTLPSVTYANFTPAEDVLEGEVTIDYAGHSTYVITTPAGVTIATDFSGVYGADPLPRIVTMNKAHSTHHTDFVDPGIEHVLRGWNPEGGPARHALVVDDDIRNIFALTSVLEEHHMLVVSAENGKDAIKTLQACPDIDVVLMDIMMPQMDGMETTRQIRLDPRFRQVPIIAVTAKAMKGDREKCIEAGAWDYLAKPVDPEELVAMLRAWLVR